MKYEIEDQVLKGFMFFFFFMFVFFNFQSSWQKIEGDTHHPRFRGALRHPSFQGGRPKAPLFAKNISHTKKRFQCVSPRFTKRGTSCPLFPGEWEAWGGCPRSQGTRPHGKLDRTNKMKGKFVKKLREESKRMMVEALTIADS